MGQPSSKDEMTIRHQFDRLCQMALKGEAVNYYKHMDYRRKHEVAFSELSEKELSKLFTMDEYGTEYHHFEVHGYDIEVKNGMKCMRQQGMMHAMRHIEMVLLLQRMAQIYLSCLRKRLKMAQGMNFILIDGWNMLRMDGKKKMI